MCSIGFEAVWHCISIPAKGLSLSLCTATENELTVEEWIAWMEEKKKKGMTQAQQEEYERRKAAYQVKRREREEKARREEEEKKQKTLEKIQNEMM